MSKKIIDKMPRKSRASRRYSLRRSIIPFWHVLFPDDGQSANTVILGWLIEGLLRNSGDKIVFKPNSNAVAPRNWNVALDDMTVTWSIATLPQIPVLSRPLLLGPSLIVVPDFGAGYPIERLTAMPDNRHLLENVVHLFNMTVAEIDQALLRALRSALVRNQLVVTGIPAGSPFATRSRLPLGEARRGFTLEIEKNRICFGSGTPDLVDVEISAVAAAPGKTKSLEHEDAQYVEKLKLMLARDPKLGIMKASEMLGSGLPGYGSDKSKQDRIRRRYNREKASPKR
jgi:hypothetical protein